MGVRDPLRFAVVGFGYIGLRHAHIIKKHPNARLVAVADIDVRRKNLADQLEVPFYDSAEALFAQAQPLDVVCIATPNGLHAPLALSALQNGCHVVIEKPMALSKAECEAVIHRSLQVGKQVFCVMQNRYSPPAIWLKHVLNEGRLGAIYLVQVNCFWNRDDRYYRTDGGTPHPWKGTRKLDGGPLFTQFSHFVDMLYWLFGDIDDIQARFANFNHRHNTEFDDDTGLITFRFKQGGMGCFQYSTAVWDKNLESRLTVLGENGSVQVGGQYMERVTYCHIKDYELPELPKTNPPNDYGMYQGTADNHQLVIENVIDTLAGKSTITTNALEGMKVVEIIERIYANR